MELATYLLYAVSTSVLFLKDGSCYVYLGLHFVELGLPECYITLEAFVRVLPLLNIGMLTLFLPAVEPVRQLR